MSPLNNQIVDMHLAGQSGYMELKTEIEAFLFYEADLLDNRQFDAWLELLSEDLVYFMPIRHNVSYTDDKAKENTQQGQGISWFDEDKWTLTKRVEQIQTGHHYAEEPLSRTAHLITNVRLLSAEPDMMAADQVRVGSHFLVQQNRIDYETHSFVGRRTDTLVRQDGAWRLRRREILLEQSILLAKNLSIFF